MIRLPALLLSAALLALPTAPAYAMDHVAWSRNANIYEVNVRQYTQEGTFNAFAQHLPRLKKMGVDILWLMPINPIGEKNRKGPLGSYYAVRDYTAVNPEFGTLDDLRKLVKQAHALGMRVIIDWVPNHTAWDHPWVTQHPDWYKKNAKGEIYAVTWNPDSPNPEYWTDVVGLDYSNKDLWAGMIEAMSYWLREADIDGFRCDVAGNLPTPFWNEARQKLDRVKPVFMLAESDKPELHAAAFDMTYGWDSGEIFKAIAKGKADASALKAFIEQPKLVFPADAYRMRFTSNHDWNSWEGSDVELYGPAAPAMAVLAATLPGMPLVYGGQEGKLDKRIEFFQKDPIDWKGYPLAGFYAQLLKLKHANPALWNGQYGAKAEVLPTDNSKVFAFRRQKDKNVVTVAVNLSGTAQRVALPGRTRPLELPAWGHHIDAKSR
ncbi:alpha-amylase [Massilia arenosa]|uniref:Alpha-amylase n=1 Tax=Zemynaea arenosa TaxID=2561931 RepID=A0A4Y9SHM7_9BURK|nr:alpha-amylase family glycosyl hydrolase [Massilia arenosa]TFW24040.1 alpha-amylase [Massilia arenosa]